MSTYDSLRKYAVKAVARILPLDAETCTEMVNYTLTLLNSEIESHLLDLLGHSDESYELISKFTELKRAADDYRMEASSFSKPKNSEAPQWGLSAKPPPQKLKARLLNNKTSTTVSELASLKPSNQLTNIQAKKLKKKNLDNLKDIDAVLNELEVERTIESSELEFSSKVPRECNCMATRHPLFKVAPNCLNCGKIICAKEGLQPCSSCGNELLSEYEKKEIIKVLYSERELLEKKRAHDRNKQIQLQSVKPTKFIKFSNATGSNLWKAQEEAFKLAEMEAIKRREQEEEEKKKKKEIEGQIHELEHYKRIKNIDEALLNAKERLETLLHFQETGAERSTIIDNAADFEMPSKSSGSMWLSPAERALQLKKQQKQLRSMKDTEQARTGRSKKVVEMVIKYGKVKMVEKTVQALDKNPEYIEELEKDIRREKLAKEHDLSKNVWDYKNDLSKWEKPIYVSKEGQSSLVRSPVLGSSRVQHETPDSIELLAFMSS